MREIEGGLMSQKDIKMMGKVPDTGKRIREALESKKVNSAIDVEAMMGAIAEYLNTGNADKMIEVARKNNDINLIGDERLGPNLQIGFEAFRAALEAGGVKAPDELQF